MIKELQEKVQDLCRWMEENKIPPYVLFNLINDIEFQVKLSTALNAMQKMQQPRDVSPEEKSIIVE